MGRVTSLWLFLAFSVFGFQQFDYNLSHCGALGLSYLEFIDFLGFAVFHQIKEIFKVFSHYYFK